ncbi:glycosyltransferase family 4 protein [Klebsiella pneumoniae]|uniref:glycosyltransferase family 4 protein n=1 Tax=Klebsiella pneumoniae TaxID=573 RepID=UPI003F6DB27D
MTKIVMFTRSLPMHGLGGMEVVAWDVAQALSSLGSEVNIITTKTKEFKGLHKIDGINVFFIDNVKSGKYSRNWWKESKRVFDEFYSKHCNVVFSVSSGAYGIIDYKKEYPNVSFHIQVHGSAWGEFVSKIKSRTIKGFLTSPKNIWWMLKDFKRYNEFHTVIAIGEQVQSDLIRKPYSYFLDKEKLHLIKNGIDSNLFSSMQKNINIKEKLNIDKNKKIILTACRLHPQKGVANSINAIDLIRERDDFVLVVVGDGPDLNRLKLLVKEKKLEDKVFFLGALKRSELAEVEAESDLFLFLTDRIEGLPLNVLEAASVGLPIILSKQVKLFMSNNITLVNSRDFKTIAKEIQRILNLPSESKKRYLPDEYTLQYTGKKYQDLLDSIKTNGEQN